MLRLVISPDTGEGDLSRNADNSLVDDDGLETVVTILLWTDARADDDDGIGADEDRRGWWFDAFDEEQPGESTGSKIWTVLEREPLTDASLAKVQAFAREAIETLVTAGAARAVEAEAVRVGDDGAELRARIYKPDDINSPYAQTWELHFAV